MKYVNRICVRHTDEDGREIVAPQWFDIPEPDRFSTDGYSQIERYVARLIDSTSRIVSLGVNTPDGQAGVGLTKEEGTLSLFMSVERTEVSREQAIVRFFEQRKLDCIADWLGTNGGIPDSTRL